MKRILAMVLCIAFMGCSTITNPVGYVKATKNVVAGFTFDDYPEDPLWFAGGPESDEAKQKRYFNNAVGVAFWPITVPIIAVVVALVGPDYLGYGRNEE